MVFARLREAFARLDAPLPAASPVTLSLPEALLSATRREVQAVPPAPLTGPRLPSVVRPVIDRLLGPVLPVIGRYARRR